MGGMERFSGEEINKMKRRRRTLGTWGGSNISSNSNSNNDNNNDILVNSKKCNCRIKKIIGPRRLFGNMMGILMLGIGVLTMGVLGGIGAAEAIIQGGAGKKPQKKAVSANNNHDNK